MLSCRALWSSVEGNSDDICRKRAELDSIVAKVPGVEFFISAITGTSTNCGDQAQVSIRPGIGYLVSFSKNTMACEMGVFNAIHDSGMDATVSQIKTSKLSKDPVLQCLKQVVKDHNSTYATTLVENSLRKFEVTSSEILCKTPCCLVVVNEGLNAPLRNAANNLKAVGMLISFSSMWADEEVEIPAEPNTGIGKALQTVRCAMAKVGHALHLGELYSRQEKAKYTYMPFCSAETYIKMLLRNPTLQDDIILHVPQLVKMLSGQDSPIADQLKFNYDLIEVLNGKSLKLSYRGFVKTPLELKDLGKVSPRSFADYTIDTTLDGGAFETSIKNSFPDVADRVNFVNKLYQVLLYGQFPHKIPKLVVCGETNSGKTSWAKLFYGLLRPSKIASVTREKTFGLSQVENDTEVIFIDEWSEDTMTVDNVKKVFQGGPFLKAVKNQSPVLIDNNAGMLVACNNEPKFKQEQNNVDSRIHVFKTKTLKHTDGNAPKWILENAMRCLVWMICEINRNITHLPIEERFYEKKWNEPAEFNLPKHDLSVELKKIMSLTATDIKEVRIEKHSAACSHEEAEQSVPQSTSGSDSDSSDSSQSDNDGLNVYVSSNQVESDIDRYETSVPPRNIYRCSDVNTPAYFKEVRRILNNNMDAMFGRVSGLNYLTFMNKYSKRKPAESSKIPDPKIDAWLCVAGRRRDVFNLTQFIKTYPSIKDRITELREICQISPAKKSDWKIPKEHRATPDTPRKRLYPIENEISDSSMSDATLYSDDDYLLPEATDFEVEQINLELRQQELDYSTIDVLGRKHQYFEIIDSSDSECSSPMKKRKTTLRKVVSSDDDDDDDCNNGACIDEAGILNRSQVKSEDGSVIRTLLYDVVNQVEQINDNRHQIISLLNEMINNIEELE